MIYAALHGRAGADAVRRVTKARDKSFATCAIAVDMERHKEGEDRPPAEWVNLIAFGHAGKALFACKKGEMLSASGRLERQRWTKDGEEKTRLSMVCDSVISARTVRPGGGGKKKADDAPPDF